MNLAGFCRNCLSNWYQEAASGKGHRLGKEEAREIVYGMAYEAWKAKFQSGPKRKTPAAGSAGWPLLATLWISGKSRPPPCTRPSSET